MFSTTSFIAAFVGLTSLFPSSNFFTSAAPIDDPLVRDLLAKRDAQKPPHQFIYSDKSSGMDNPPKTSAIPGWNSFGLAFWLTEGPWDNVQSFINLDEATRKSIKADYSAAGVKLIVSAFGATDVPTTAGADPTKTASDLAAFVKQYELDGVDVDYEDFDAVNSGKAEAWLITFTQALRKDLPQGDYQLTHAPVAPWFTDNTTTLPGGGYLKVHSEVGDLIDFYNIQFYNQGSTVYTDCDSLINTSNLDGYPHTSVNEIIAAGVPGDKVLIGKPGSTGSASSGYVAPADLATCVSQAKSSGWNGGLMIWQYPDPPTDYVSQVWGS